MNPDRLSQDRGTQTSGIAAAWSGFLDLLLPARCPACGSLIDDHGSVCADCWTKLTFIDRPFCESCGLPFDIDLGEEATCAACLAAPPPFAPLRSAVVYDDGSRPIILRFKHADATHCAPHLAGWLARIGADLLSRADWLVPVPLHRRRLFTRRYNQAALLSHELTRICSVPSAPLALQRTKPTKSQGHLSRSDRARNVAGAFRVSPNWQDRLAGSSVVLIDDVATTGATLSACARTLQKANVSQIGSLTVARVLQS